MRLCSMGSGGYNQNSILTTKIVSKDNSQKFRKDSIIFSLRKLSKIIIFWPIKQGLLLGCPENNLLKN
jgi:hypothetical protein